MNQHNDRFSSYDEIIRNNQVIGFKLDNNDFEFIFDEYGGWFDQDGKYYNSDAIQCDPPEDQNDAGSQTEEIPQKEELQLKQDLINLQVIQTHNRVEVIRNLNQIIDTYPEGQQIILSIRLQPPQQSEDKIIEQFLHSKLNQKVRVLSGMVISLYQQELAIKIIELQGLKLQNIKDKPRLYIDVELFDGIEISVRMSKVQLQAKLNELNYEKNIDYANIEEERDQQGNAECFLEIRGDIENQLRQDIEFNVENQ